MSRNEQCGCSLEPLEGRAFFSATWVVIPPGTGETVVEQTVPDAAVPGLINAAAKANATAGRGFNCWIVIQDSGPIG